MEQNFVIIKSKIDVLVLLLLCMRITGTCFKIIMFLITFKYFCSTVW